MRKILIANRGEIAVRIIRACRDMSITPVVIFSEADRQALHLRMADEAYCVGPPPASESYLLIDRILEIAKTAGVDAIHPGYGFLAENPQFAKAVEESGLIFIGPGWHAISRLGEKTTARQIARQAGAPVVPGSSHPAGSLEEARRQAEEVGYPILLKAAAGGGGKGMRLVSNPNELDSAFGIAQSEAQSAFGNGAVYCEKYLVNPRHVEIQILGDRSGHMIHLGERECSLQRRHQKVIEECPSPLNDPSLRQEMGRVAVRVALAAGYYNAGTVEFLVDEEKKFYFLEINTRLQVEHPVTEMVTGIDLVREQIKIASGEPLILRQEEILLRGTAIECRIYAEDPERNFIPCPGRIVRHQPPGGPGIRVDSGVFSGWEVPLYYDPLISKLVAWGLTRAEAIDRMRRALDEYVLDGIGTTIPFYREIFRDPDFVQGKMDIGYIDRLFERRDQSSETQSITDALLITGAYQHARQAISKQTTNHIRSPHSSWKVQGRRQQMDSRL